MLLLPFIFCLFRLCVSDYRAHPEALVRPPLGSAPCRVMRRLTFSVAGSGLLQLRLPATTCGWFQPETADDPGLVWPLNHACASRPGCFTTVPAGKHRDKCSAAAVEQGRRVDCASANYSRYGGLEPHVPAGSARRACRPGGAAGASRGWSATAAAATTLLSFHQRGSTALSHPAPGWSAQTGG